MNKQHSREDASMPKSIENSTISSQNSLNWHLIAKSCVKFLLAGVSATESVEFSEIDVL